MAPAFSIREYAASMRGSAAAGPPLLGIEELPPMPVRRFRWWVHAATSEAAAAAPRSPGKPRAPKKRSISDLFAAARPVAGDGCGGGEEADTDEVMLCEIMKLAKEKKRKRRSEEARMRSQTGGSSGGGEEHPDGSAAVNSARKEIPVKPKMPNPRDATYTYKKPEGEQRLKIQEEKMANVKRRNPGKIKTHKLKLKYIQSTKAKARKPRDLAKMLPLHSILKKHTKCTSVKMVKDKQSNSKGTGVIELCHKSVKHVTFSGVDDIRDSRKENSELPQLQSLCKLFSDVLASSSSSTEMSSEGDKSISADSSSSHAHEKSFVETKQSNEITGYEDSSEPSSTGLSYGLIDLNCALPGSTDLNSPYVTNSKVPNLEHKNDETSDSDLQILGHCRGHVLKPQQDSWRAENGIFTSALERNKKWVSDDKLLPAEVITVSNEEVVGLPLNLSGEFINLHTDFRKSSVSDTRMKGKSPCALQNHTIQYSIQPPQNWWTTNSYHGKSQLFTGGEVPCCRCQECNLSHTDIPTFLPNVNVNELSCATRQTVRLMGKDLTVCTTRSESLGETAQRDRDTSSKVHLTTKVFLELPRQAQPFLSLQAQSFPNASANSISTSQGHFGYGGTENLNYPLTAVNVYSGNQTLYEDMGCFSTSHRSPNVLSRFSPFPDQDSTRFSQNSVSPWCYSDPFARTGATEPRTAPLLPTFTTHAPPSSVYNARLPQPSGVYSASSSLHPHDGVSITYALNQPNRVIQEVPDLRSDVAHPSRNTNTETSRENLDNSGASASILRVPRSGPVKLSAGAKHVLKPSDETTGEDNSVPVYSCVSFVPH